MDTEWQSFDDGWESPSGSGAGDSDDTGWSYHLASMKANAAAMLSHQEHLVDDQFADEEQTAADYATLVARVHAMSVQQSTLKGRERYSAKQGPSWDPSLSYWRFETDVWDWNDVTLLDRNQRGPELRNRLSGECETFKRDLDREKLRQGTDDEGIKYFLREIRKHWLKNSMVIWLCRLRNYLGLQRKGMEWQLWLQKYDQMLARLEEAWMDTFDELPQEDFADDMLDDVNRYRTMYQLGDDVMPRQALAVKVAAYNGAFKRHHKEQFWVNGNIKACMFLSLIHI